MEFEVKLPRLSTVHTNGQNIIKVNTDGTTVGDVLNSLIATYPGLENQLYKDGELHSHINVFVDLEDIRFLGGTGLELTSQDQKIDIIPAVAGG